MEVIESRIDTNSDDYKANQEAMLKMVAELKAELTKAREERSPKAIQRNEELGKLPVQKRLDLLLDRNTPWLEIAPLAAKDMYDRKVHGAGKSRGNRSDSWPRVPGSCQRPNDQGRHCLPFGG